MPFTMLSSHLLTFSTVESVFGFLFLAGLGAEFAGASIILAVSVTAVRECGAAFLVGGTAAAGPGACAAAADTATFAILAAFTGAPTGHAHGSDIQRSVGDTFLSEWWTSSWGHCLFSTLS